jgi:hypothetical protein
MELRNLKWFFSKINAFDLRAKLGHAFSQDATAAAHIKNLTASQLGKPINPIKPQGVDLVQGTKLAVGVPPA